MKNTLKKVALVLAFIGATFLQGKFVLAAPALASYTPDLSLLSGGSSIVPSSASSTSYTGQMFTVPVGGVITGFTFQSVGTSATSSYSYGYKLFNASGTALITGTESTQRVVGDQPWTITFSSPVSVSSGLYFFGLHYNSGSTPNAKTVVYNTGDLVGGCRMIDYAAGASFSLSSCTDTSDAWFTANTAASVNILYPANNGTANFNAWVLSYSSLIGGDTTFGVRYSSTTTGLSSSTLRYDDSSGLSLAGAGFGNFTIGKSQTLVSGQQYYALAYMTQASTTVFSTTSTFVFLTNNFVDTSFLGLQSTSLTNASTTSDYTCSTGGLICKLVVYLFVPQPDAFDDFKQIGALVQNKPPFGYISAISAIVSTTTLSSGTSTYSIVSGVHIGFFDSLTTALGYLLWLLFGFWIIKRFSLFDFHQ